MASKTCSDESRQIYDVILYAHVTGTPLDVATPEAAERAGKRRPKPTDSIRAASANRWKPRILTILQSSKSLICKENKNYTDLGVGKVLSEKMGKERGKGGQKGPAKGAAGFVPLAQTLLISRDFLGRPGPESRSDLDILAEGRRRESNLL